MNKNLFKTILLDGDKLKVRAGTVPALPWIVSVNRYEPSTKKRVDMFTQNANHSAATAAIYAARDAANDMLINITIEVPAKLL